jgi:hypothetical protein
MKHAFPVLYLQIGILVCLASFGSRALGGDSLRAAKSGLWDPQRYIGIDEIQRGMDGYCLTDYGEAGVEKFAVKVVNIIHDYEPDHNLILIMGLDERFKHTGVVAGCSGSPVYIDGRLAGALARGWVFQKDPLYGVTPIAEMLEVGVSNGAKPSTSTSQALGLQFDFSKPVNLGEIDKQIAALRPTRGRSQSGATALPCPLLISGLASEVCRQLAPQFEAMGFVAVPGLSGTAQADAASAASFVPGGVLAIPLVAGDIKIDVMGTITEVRGNRVFGLGHGLSDLFGFGFGATNLPMAGGQIYTVVSQMTTSFKLGAAGDIVGAISIDESVGIYGEIGAKAKMIPLSVHVEPCNGTAPRTYNCQIAYHRLLTPLLAHATIVGATMPFDSSFPPDHTVDYSAAIHLENGQSIQFANTSTENEIAEMVVETRGSLALLMNNPFGCPEVTSVDANVRVSPRNIGSYIWSVNIADSTVKPGQDIHLEFVIASFLKEKRRYEVTLSVPKHVAPGKYNVMLLGCDEYESFLRKVVPYRFLATNRKTLVEALNGALNVRRTKLYCLLLLPPEGIAIDKAELPGLPETKSMILQGNKWAMPAQPYPRWVEKDVETGTIVADKETVPITVEE